MIDLQRFIPPWCVDRVVERRLRPLLAQNQLILDTLEMFMSDNQAHLDALTATLTSGFAEVTDKVGALTTEVQALKDAAAAGNALDFGPMDKAVQDVADAVPDLPPADPPA